MPEIRQLPAAVVNKIAAGEVIERPASVVKELMENAVDAGATRIDVSVEQGGSQRVRVTDNGCGMAADQLTLAVASHATSKISSADDLFHVETLGFRGEALASIAEVSNFRLRSRTAEVEVGAELELAGGRPAHVAPCGCPVGTRVEVDNLFYNTPVRRKFLRTTQTEMGHIAEAFTRVALPHPGLHFTLRHNERLLHDLPPVENWRERIAALFGADLGEGLIRVESDDALVHIRGYVADPSFSRANNRMQYLFLNGRHIRDRSLQHALSEAYRGLLLSGRYPIVFLRLQMPPTAVDVNVHPTKLEVRFQDGGRIYSRLLGTLRNHFLTTDLTARVRSEPARESGDDLPQQAELAQQRRRELGEWARAEAAGNGLQPRAGRQAPLDLQPQPPSWTSPPRPDPAQPAADPANSSLPGADLPPVTEPAPPPPDPQPAAAPGQPRGLQLHNRYLITEHAQGMVVIDQHALHERILYEELRRKVLGGTLETQRLLVPEPVALTPSEAATALDARDTLAKLGIGLEPFGGDTVLVTSYPAMLARLHPAEMLRQLLEHLHQEGKKLDRRDLLDQLLHTMACKAAIKAGDRLSGEEITALLQRGEICQDAHHCPHGRPTALVFTKDELDKRFKRI